jgi:hypothetical protein
MEVKHPEGQTPRVEGATCLRHHVPGNLFNDLTIGSNVDLKM